MKSRKKVIKQKMPDSHGNRDNNSPKSNKDILDPEKEEHTEPQGLDYDEVDYDEVDYYSIKGNYYYYLEVEEG